MRFRANLIDNFFTFTIIGGIANIFLAIYKTTTLGYLITGIEYQDEEGQKLQWRQKWLRLLTNYPLYTAILLCFWLIFIGIIQGVGGEGTDRGDFFTIIFGIILFFPMIYWRLLGFWTFIEVLWSTPNWVERKLKTRRVQARKPILWILFAVIVGVIAIVKLLTIWRSKNIGGIHDQADSNYYHYTNDPSYSTYNDSNNIYNDSNNIYSVSNRQNYHTEECIEPENPYDEYNEEWHYAGFERAERTGWSCNGNSDSFNEWCETYHELEEEYNECINNQ